MADVTAQAHPNKSVARKFAIYGTIGFWVQLVFLIVVILLGSYILSVAGSNVGIARLFAFLVLVLPIFTTFWCWRYARLGRALDAGAPGIGPAALSRSAWIGVWVGAAGALVSLLSLLAAGSTLLVTLLSNPQIGIQVSPAAQGASAYTVSAIDAVSIMSLLLTLTAELLVVAISLRLVFVLSRVSRDGVKA